MAEYQAARVDDPIAHTASQGWMIAGLIGGALLGMAAVAVTGGAALIVVSTVAAGACAGGGLGEVLGSMSWAPRHVTGMLKEGSPDVFINSRKAIRAHLSSGECDEHSGSLQRVAEGSIKVYINNYPAARIGDRLTCSAEIFQGSANVFIGGAKVQTDDINPEIPAWVNWVMLGVGVGALAVIAGPAIALISTAGGMAGGTAGDYVGGKIFGEGSDGQKWSMLAGGIIGSGIAAKGTTSFRAWRAGKVETNGVPIDKVTYDEILNIPKGQKPDPETYLPPEYINKHAEEFSEGATRIVSRGDYDMYGLGKPDDLNSEFVSSKRNMESIVNESNGDTTVMSERLGIPKEQFEQGDLLRVDYFPTEKYNAKIPTGNEWGARDTEPLWLPGGKLPNGDYEAVISMKGLEKGVDYQVYDLKTGAIYD
ncbi:PAAR domain-containing protein [Kosakonia sp. H02]|nr:PAAR domain-containing protein [Kosakonia sp. H02]